jgi:DNA-binding XRE family transcriptional regulator
VHIRLTNDYLEQEIKLRPLLKSDCGYIFQYDDYSQQIDLLRDVTVSTMKTETVCIEAAFGIVIRKLRNDLGISQEVLAFESGLDRSYISQLERGKRQASIITIFQISKALKTLPDNIVRLVQDMHYGVSTK